MDTGTYPPDRYSSEICRFLFAESYNLSLPRSLLFLLYTPNKVYIQVDQLHPMTGQRDEKPGFGTQNPGRQG